MHADKVQPLMRRQEGAQRDPIGALLIPFGVSTAYEHLQIRAPSIERNLEHRIGGASDDVEGGLG